MAGWWIPLRSPALDGPDQGIFLNDASLDYAQAMQQLTRRPAEDAAEYVGRVTRIVNQTLVHHWTPGFAQRYRLWVPATENYILYLLGYVAPDTFRAYEFADYRKALRRGVGLCSQHATVVTGVLQRNGVPASVVRLGGHVVTRAQVAPDRWYILDADYGIVLPHDLDELQRDPQLVHKYYAHIESMYRSGRDNIPLAAMVAIYGADDNRIMAPGVVGEVGWKAYWLERLSYVAIWLIPALLLLPCLLRRRRGARGRP